MFDLINQAGFFLLKSLAEFLSILLLMRFFMQFFRVSFSNQIGTFVVQLTNWAVLRGWPGWIVPVDVAWGVVLTASAALAGKLAQQSVERARL